MRKSLRELAVEYGAIGLGIYLTSTALVYVVFWIALQFGWSPESMTGTAGYWIAAYVAAKATQIPRIAGTVAVTPFVARAYERVVGRRAAAREAAREDSTAGRQPPGQAGP